MRPDVSMFEDRIQRVVEKYGYETPTEFVREAIRHRLEELGELQSE